RGRAPVRLDEGHDHVAAFVAQAPALLEHGVGLADAGSGAEEHPQPPPLHVRQSPTCASARFSSSTFTVGSPRYPRSRGWMCDSTSARTAAASSPRASATLATCCSAYSGLMCGSRPEPEAVTASTGTSDSATPSNPATWV